MLIDVPPRELRRIEKALRGTATPIQDFIVLSASKYADALERNRGAATSTTPSRTCAHCGRRLRGRQQKWCTDGCKMKAYRRRR